MSEFQYYEFKAIDRPLSRAERDEVSSWSSRTVASSTGAIFTYSYRDFPKDERTVVAQYFDAMFYTANWGSTRLIFKFPAGLVNIRALGQYSVEGLEVIKQPDTILVDISITNEHGYDRWIEEEGQLDSLIGLRNDIIAGDYRCLYLIWLKVSTEEAMSEWGDVDPESEEPPVPAGLQSLNEALDNFVDAFGIDPDTTAAAAAGSDPPSEDPTNYAAQIESLSDNEKNDFLRRLLQNEPLLSVKLEQRLARTVDRASDRRYQKRRTVGELAESIAKVYQVREEKKKREQKKERLAKLKHLEEQESYLWKRVGTWISEKNTKSYDEAVRILQDLKGLAISKGQYPAFRERVEAIRANNSRLSAFKNKMDHARLREP